MFFRVVIPHNRKRHCFGPYVTEIDAARKVKEFLQQLKDGSAATSRGAKRIEKFNHDLCAKLATLNQTAQQERRHFVEFADDVACQYCRKTVHKYYALTFASRQCPRLNPHLDKKGSHTRSANVAKYRQQGASSQVDTHNEIASHSNFHFLRAVSTHPYCEWCGATFKKSALKTAMGQLCPAKTQALDSVVKSSKSAPRRRLHGKQRPSS